MAKQPEFKLARKTPSASKLHGVMLTSEDTANKTGPYPWDQLAAQGFKGAIGESAVVSVGSQTVCLIGLGDEVDLNRSVWQRVGASFVRTAEPVKVASIECRSDADLEALALGLALGSYRYDKHKSDPKQRELSTISLVGSVAAKARVQVAASVSLADAVCRARDFVNEPGGSLTPERFANEARKLAKLPGISVKVSGIAEIRKAKLGGLLGVNRGSALPPRLVELSYKSAKRGAPTVGLVGKGITFDAGGLSIKSASGMSTMKCDMAGAAAVIATMQAISDTKPGANVKAWVPMTDNMLGGDATRPGDVLKMRNGKTVEVMNTDAEGRLVLADALSLASEAKVDAIIDVATLTGATSVSLASQYAALFANNDDLSEQVLAAADYAGEPVWRMPLVERYRESLDSPVADMKNIGGLYGGAITAALFLSEFVDEGIPWVHLDVAGPAFVDSPTHIGPKGGTGFAVSTLVSLIENFRVPQES